MILTETWHVILSFLNLITKLQFHWMPFRIRKNPPTITLALNYTCNTGYNDYASQEVHLGIFWVGMCRPGLQIGTPF